MRKLGIVVFGASRYDCHSHLDNPRFLASAQQFKKITTDRQIFADCQTETLDLYDQALSLSESLDKIIDFISKDHDDIIVFYCGHGDVGIRDGDYRVFLRSSNRERRHSLLNIVVLINDVKRLAQRKRVYFILDACYSGAAVSGMETMDFGGAEALIDRRLFEAVTDNGSGTAVLTASGSFGVALAKQEDELTLFTGAFVRCLGEGLIHRPHASAFSWLDLKDDIIRVTRDRLGPNAPIPRLTSFSESVSDITRVPFFTNRAFQTNGGGGEQSTELLYWKSISDESPAYVIEDFLAKFPNGVFAVPARALLIGRINRFDEKELDGHLLDHPRSPVKKQIDDRSARLKWSRLQTSANIAELEKFLQRFSESEFKEEARRRIDAIRAEAKPADPPARLDEGPTDPAPGQQFASIDGLPPPLPTPVDNKNTRGFAWLAITAAAALGFVAFQYRGPTSMQSSIERSSGPVAGYSANTQVAAPSEPPRKAEEAAGNKPVAFSTFANYDIHENDAGIFFQTNLAECNAKCRSTDGCLAFVFEKWNGACYLKKTVGPLIASPRSDTFVRADRQPFYSALPLHTCPYPGSSMRGAVIRSFGAQSTDVCRKECEAERSCVAYMFGNGQCSFFNSVSDRRTGDRGWDSGERTQDRTRC